MRASVDLDNPLHHVTLPRLSVSPAKTPLWQFSKRSMPLRLATCLRKILPSSRLHMCSSLSFTSLQPSQVGQGSLLSNRLPDPMLQMEALLRATVLWWFSKGSMPLRPATCLSKILPSSRLHSCSSLSFTSLQPSQVGQGSVLSKRLADPMLLHMEALPHTSMDSAILDPLHHVALPKMQKLSCSFPGWPSHTRLWLLSKRHIPLRLAARLSKIAPPSCLDTCSISLSLTSLQPSQVGQGSVLSNRLADPMFAILDPRHRVMPSKMQTLFSVSRAKRSLWRLSKGSMPFRLATRLRKILPSSRLHSSSSLSFTSLQPSQVGQGSVLSKRLADPMLLHMEALQRASMDSATLDPLHHVALPKMQKRSCSFPGWPSHTRPWLLSKRNIPLRLAARPSKIAPPSCLDTCSISLSLTSLQPSQVGQGWVLSNRLADPMMLRMEAPMRASVDLDHPLHHVTLPRLSVSPAKTPLWWFSMSSMPLRLATCLRKILPSSRLHSSSSRSFTSLQSSQGGKGSVLSNRLADPMLLHMEALQRASMDLAILDPLHHVALPKMQKPSCSFPGWPSHTRPWLLSKRNIPLRLAARPSKIAPPSCLHTCSISLSLTSLQPSQVGQGSLLSNRLADPMLLHMKALQRASMDLAILDPLHHVALPKMQKLSCSFPGWPSHTRAWLLSKRNIPLRLAARPSKIAPPSCLDTCSISLSFTSLQPSQAGEASLLSSRPPHVMLLYKEALQHTCVDLVILDPLLHGTPPKMQKPSCSFPGWPSHTRPWLLSKRNIPLRLAARPSKIAPPSCLHTCSISLSLTSLQPSQVGQGSLLSNRLADPMLLHMKALQRASMDLATLDPLRHVMLSKMQTLFSVSPAKTPLWWFFMSSMPFRLATCLSKILPSSRLHTCTSSRFFTSLQSSQDGTGSVLSNRLADPMFAILDPLHHVALPKMQKLSCSFPGWPSHTRPWLLSKRNIPLRLAARPSKIAPPSCLDTCSISLSLTSLQPSQVGQGWVLSNRVADPIMLHMEALLRVSVDLDHPLHHVTLPLLSMSPAKTPLWRFSKGSMPFRLATCLRKILPSSRLHSSSSLPFTSLQSSQGGKGSVLSNRLADPMLLHMEASLCASVFGILDPLHHVMLSKMQTLFSVSPAKTPLWWFSKSSMPFRLATCLSKILPCSRLHSCSSLSFTSLQSSPGGKGSVLSNRLADPMFAILDPLRHAMLSKMQKLSCSFSGWPSHTRHWLLSKRNIPLRLAARPSKIAPPSCLDTCSISLSLTSLQPSQVGQGWVLSNRVADPIMLHMEALLRVSVDLDHPLHHVTLPLLSVSPAKAPLWRFFKGSMPFRQTTCLSKIPPPSWLLSKRCKPSRPLRLAAGPSEIVSSSEMYSCASGIRARVGASAVRGQGGRVGSVHGLRYLAIFVNVCMVLYMSEMYGSAL